MASCVDHRSPLPKWYQVHAILRHELETVESSPGSLFCTQRALMSRFGVSYATVTRALDELVGAGYLFRKRGAGTFVRKPNGQLVARKPVGILVWHNKATLEHPAFAKLIRGLTGPLSRQGHNLSFIFVDDELIQEGKVPELVRAAQLGALVAPYQPELSEADFLPLVKESLPIVFLNLDFPAVSPLAIRFDLSEALALGTRHLLECGYGSISFVVPPDLDAARLVAPSRAALARCEHQWRPGMVASADGSIDAGRAAADALLSRASGPRCGAGVVVVDDLAALGVLRRGQEMGLSVPDELGVVTIGDFLPPGLVETPLTAVPIPFVEMGRLAARMVLDILDARSPDVTRRVLSPELVQRRTTAALPSRCQNNRTSA